MLPINLYWGSDAVTKLKGYSAFVHLPTTRTNLTYFFPDHTDLPPEATHILVFSSNRNKEMETGNSTVVKDHSYSGAKSDCLRKNGSKITLKNKNDGKSGTDKYQIYFEDDASIVITYKKNIIVSAAYGFWGESWDWANYNIKVTRRIPSEITFSGKGQKLGLVINGIIKNTEENILNIEYSVDVSDDLPNLRGLGIQFDLETSSNAFDKNGKKPVLLPDNKGWRWELARGDSIQFSSSRSTDAYFEIGDSGTIRSFFIQNDANQGAKTRYSFQIRLPAQGALINTPTESYNTIDYSTWYSDVFDINSVPIDLSYLNEKPAGKHGFIKAVGDKLIAEDGTIMRFFGTNITSYALFGEEKAIDVQAKRIAQLGYNLVRLHHHDSMRWVDPTVIDKSRSDSRELNPAAMRKIDYWIESLKKQGIYIWLDLHVGRVFKEGDAEAKPEKERFKEFFGEGKKEGEGKPLYNAIFRKEAKKFAGDYNLNLSETKKTWEPGSSKLFLNNKEHGFNRPFLDYLQNRLKIKILIATTNTWGGSSLFSLPALTEGGIIDVHAYGKPDALNTNPLHEPNYISWASAGQVYDKPMSITEWNVPYPAEDRFAAPLYFASIAALQGWDAVMLYAYTQRLFNRNKPGTWSTFSDPAISGVIPAAAIAFRQQHIHEACRTYCLKLLKEDLFFKRTDPTTSMALRTLAEKSKLTIGMPKVKELPWLQETNPADDVIVFSDPDHSFIPMDSSFVDSDTGELRRYWRLGIQTVNTEKTQAASGWIGDKI